MPLRARNCLGCEPAMRVPRPAAGRIVNTCISGGVYNGWGRHGYEEPAIASRSPAGKVWQQVQRVGGAWERTVIEPGLEVVPLEGRAGVFAIGIWKRFAPQGLRIAAVSISRIESITRSGWSRWIQ